MSEETAHDVICCMIDVLEAEAKRWRLYANKPLLPGQNREQLARDFVLRRTRSMRAYFAGVEETETERRRASRRTLKRNRRGA